MQDSRMNMEQRMRLLRMAMEVARADGAPVTEDRLMEVYARLHDAVAAGAPEAQPKCPFFAEWVKGLAPSSEGVTSRSLYNAYVAFLSGRGVPRNSLPSQIAFGKMMRASVPFKVTTHTFYYVTPKADGDASKHGPSGSGMAEVRQ